MNEIIVRKLKLKAYQKFILGLALCFGLVVGAILSVLSMIPGTEGIYHSEFTRLNLQTPGRYAGLLPLVSFPALYLGCGLIIALLSFWGFNWTAKSRNGIRITGSFTREPSGAIKMEKISMQSYVKLILLISIWTGICYGVLDVILRLFKINLNIIKPLFIIPEPFSKFLTATTFPIQFLLEGLVIAIISFGLFNVFLTFFNLTISGGITWEKLKKSDLAQSPE